MAWSARQFLKTGGFLLAVLAIAGTATWLILAAVEERWPFEPGLPPRPEFQPRRYMPPLEPFTQFPIVTAAEVKNALDPAELVLGVTIKDQSRAYPLNVLTEMPERKAVNDILGGQTILVTWCDACHSGIVYDRAVEGRTLIWGVSGQLWKDSMVLYDPETMSLWSQLGGQAKDGPLKGARLRRLPSVVTDWESWRRLYPNSTVLLLPREHVREFRRDFYQQPENFVLGISDGQSARSWRLDELRHAPVRNEEWAGQPVLVVFDSASSTAALYERRLGTEELTFQLSGDKVVDEQSQSTWNPVTGEAEKGSHHGSRPRRLPAVLATRSAWEAFHPARLDHSRVSRKR